VTSGLGMKLLLQVSREKERALGFRPHGVLQRPPAIGNVCPSSSSTATASRNLRGAELANRTLGLNLPLLLCSAGCIDFEEEELAGGEGAAVQSMEVLPGSERGTLGSLFEEDAAPSFGPSPAGLEGAAAPTEADASRAAVTNLFPVAIVAPLPSSNKAALQALQLSNAAVAGGSSDDGGTWLIFCRSEGDRIALLAQLQLSGCIMHDIGSRYRVGELLGVGASSKVFLAEDLQNGAEVAVKIVSKKGGDKDLALLREATILRWSCHESVLQFLGIYEIQEPSTGQGAWAIVSEFVGGGELFEEVRKHGPLEEDRARNVAHQLFSALDFLHHRGIVHRDIKTENVCKTGLGDEIKLVDFGLATPEWDNTAMLTRCGSPGYIAPEVLRGDRYGCKVDCFSVGVLLYILLAGYGPFRGQTLEEMLLRNMKCKVSLRGLSARCSGDAKSLVSLLLVPDADLRPSAEQSLAHIWLASRQGSDLGAASGSGGYDEGAPASGTPNAAAAAAVAPLGSSEGAGVGKRERRRLFSVQLGCADMFYKGLKFADEDQSAGMAVADPSGELAAAVGVVEDNSSAMPDIPRPAAAAPGATGGEVVPLPPAVEPPALMEDDDQYRRSFEQDVPLPNAVHTHTAELPWQAAMGPSYSSGAASSGSRGQPHRQQLRQEGDAMEEPQRLTLDMLRTCEPLWADVQRTLTNMKVQGHLPEHTGIKTAHTKMHQYARSSSKYTNAGRNRGNAATTQEAVERSSAYFMRDLGKKQSFMSSGSFGRERKTAFFHRDLGRAESHTSAALLADDRPSFASLGASVAQEERTSAFFTRPNGREDPDSEEEEETAGDGRSQNSQYDDATAAALFSEMWSEHGQSGSSGEEVQQDGGPLSLRKSRRHVKRAAPRGE